MAKRRKKAGGNAVGVIVGIVAIIAALFVVFGCMVSTVSTEENKASAATVALSAENKNSSGGDRGTIPDEYLYNTYDYDPESIREYCNTDLKLICDNLNSVEWFVIDIAGQHQMGEYAIILQRQFKYLPVAVNLAFIDTDGTIAVNENCATFNAVFGIYTILQTTSGLVDNGYTVESWEDVEKLVSQGLAKYEDFHMYDLYYTELSFGNAISTGFGHELQTQEVITKPWTRFEIWSKTRENKYISINKDCSLRYLTAAEEDYTINFAVHLDELGISREEIRHKHNYYAPMSKFLAWLKEEDIENGSQGNQDGTGGGTGNPGDTGDGDKDDGDGGDITIKFPYPCHYCGYMIQNPDDIMGHHCLKPPEAEDKPGDNAEDDDKDDNQVSGGDKDENGSQGGLVDGDKKEEIIQNEYKFSFGHFSFNNLKNIFNKDFWEALVKGEIEIDWYGMFLSVLYVIAAVAAVIIVVKLIKRIGKAGNKK